MKRHPFIRLVLLFRQHLNWMLLSALVGFLTIGSSVGLMMTSAYIIAKAALHPSIAELQLAIVGVRFFGIFRGVFRYVERLVSHDTTFKLLAHLRVWFYRALEPLAPARLQQFRSGDIHHRILSDIQNLEHFFVRVLLPPVVAVFILILGWLIYGSFHWHLAAIISGGFLTAGVLLPLGIYRMTTTLGKELTTLQLRLNALTTDALSGLEELLLFNALNTAHQDFQHLHQRYLQLQQRMANITGLQEGMLHAIQSITILLVFLFTAPLIATGRMDGVYLAMLVIGVIALFEAVTPLPAAFQHYTAAKQSASHLFAIVDTQPIVPETGFQVEITHSPPEVRIHLPAFTYPDSTRPALQDFSLTLPPGKRVAIVGETGAGKSTVFNLLLRFWPYQTGSIQLNGTELSTIHPERAREVFSTITQSTILLTGTIRDNLLLARPHASEEELWSALEAAQLAGFVRQLPGGLDAEVGTEGWQFSGGERQRLALARALLKNAPIFLLDEPTANLDAATEQAVIQAILQATQEKSLLLITHRLVGMDAMDEILVLKNGRTVEQGTHTALLQRDGYYARLYTRQQESRMVEKLSTESE